QSFCHDIKLLKSAGLLPIVVHDGNGDITSQLVALLNLDGGHAIGVSGKDGGLLRATNDGVATDATMLEMFLSQGYVPVVSTYALGDGSPHVDTDLAAAEIAIALKSHKLIYLANAPGLMDRGELVTDLPADDLERRGIAGAMTHPIVRALRNHVGRVHVIDGR